MSQIYYKFKSAKDYDNITFDGLGISVFDAKKEILVAKRLKGNDFDIVVSHAESGEDYQEDTALIPRNTPIVVRRVPTKPGKGTAHRYLEGAPTAPRNVTTGNRVNYGNLNGSMSKTFDLSKQQHQTQTSRPSPVPTTNQTSGEEQTEEDRRIAAMFAQSSEFWEKTQEQMASKPALRRPNQPRPQVKQQIQKALPPNYVCYRCGQKGHWIQACPTNGDRSFDHMKVRKTTGIPRSFLQKVEQVPPGKGVLVTQDGNLVIAQANDAAWQKFHARQKSYVTTNEVLEDTFPVPHEFQCMICARLLREAVITPCCQASFCDECIRTALINPEQEDQQFKCPSCRSPLLPDDLLPDKATREAVDNHLRDWARRRNEQIVPEGNGEDDAADNNNNNNNNNNSNNNDDNVLEESTIEMPISTDSIEKEQRSTDLVINEQPLPAVKVEDKDKEFESADLQEDITEDGAQQTTATATSTQPPKVKAEPSAKVELPKKPTHDLPQVPSQQQSGSSQQAQAPQQSQQSSQFQPQQQLSRQQHQFPNANGKAFPQQNPTTAQQQATYGQFGYYNDYGFGYDQGQYWYDDAGYPQMNMNMMNAPGGYYDPSYFESGFYPAEPFPAQPQFMPPFRPPVYDDFWDNRPMMPPQGNFTPFGNNMGGSMGGAMQPFRGGGFRGGFLQRGGSFQNRGRGGGRGRGPGFFHEQRPFNSGRGNNNDFRRESSMGPSTGRREASEREYREGESKYDDDRLVDDFGRDLARRKSSVSHHSLDKENDTREKLSPSLISDRDRRDRDVIPDEDLEIRRREKARSHSRSRSKERRSSSRSHHRSSRRNREGSHHSRSPSRHDRMLYDERRKSSTSSRRRSRSREIKDDRRYVNDRRYYDDDRRYSVSERREERRESMSDRRSDRDRDRRESLSDRRDGRDDRRDSYNSSRYDSRRESISDRKDRRISMDEKKDEMRNQGLHNERYEIKARTKTPSPNRTLDDENGKILYHSPQREFDVEMQDIRSSQVESIGQAYDDTERQSRQSRSESPKPIIDTEEFQVPEEEDDNVIDVSNDDLMEDDDIYQIKDDMPTTPPSPDKDHSSSSGKRRHSSSHKHRSNKYHRSSHHRRESLDKEDHERRSSMSKSRHNTYPKEDYHRSGSRKHKKHHSSRHHSSRHHSSRSKDGDNNRRRHHSRERDERR